MPPSSAHRSPLVDIIACASANFMKIAPVIRAVQEWQRAGSPPHYRLVHGGSHYDARMEGDFFTQRGTPARDVNLEVGCDNQG